MHLLFTSLNFYPCWPWLLQSVYLASSSAHPYHDKNSTFERFHAWPGIFISNNRMQSLFTTRAGKTCQSQKKLGHEKAKGKPKAAFHSQRGEKENRRLGGHRVAVMSAFSTHSYGPHLSPLSPMKTKTVQNSISWDKVSK